MLPLPHKTLVLPIGRTDADICGYCQYFHNAAFIALYVVDYIAPEMPAYVYFL
jgi:hypothetical protein